MNEVVFRINNARLCNEALDTSLDPEERSAMIASAAKKIEELFDVLRIAHRHDHNTRETPRRVAKMLVEELLRGRYTPPPQITEFQNAGRYDQLIVTGPIEVRSMCAHHMMPIFGEAYVGVLPSPDGSIVGLSKYDRIVDYFASRLQIQEELVKQIGDHIVDMTNPRGLAVQIRAVHMCKTHRGVCGSMNSRMVNSAYYGAFLEDADLKREFLQHCSTQPCHG